MKNITHKLFFVVLLLMGTTIYAQESSEENWEDLEELEEIVLVGGGVIDLATSHVQQLEEHHYSNLEHFYSELEA